MTPDEYKRRDYPIKCYVCRRWMRRGAVQGGKYAVRSPAPHAGHCVECWATRQRPASPRQSDGTEKA